jgi:hypothetical protein
MTHLRTNNPQLQLPLPSTNQLPKLLTRPFQQPQPIILRQRAQEILDCTRLVRSTGVLLEFLDDLGLVGLGEGGRTDEGLQTGLVLEDLEEGGDGAGGRVEG